MTIKQLSIFIENRSGTLQRVLELLRKLHIQIIACTFADTAEYGLLRVICSEPERACRELKAVDVAVTISEVYAVELDNQPGGAADVVGAFSRADIDITYMYAFLLDGRGIMIFKPARAVEAEEVIRANNLRCLSEKDLPVNA